MKNLPKKIYLNLGDLTEEEYNELDFKDLFSEEVTWSEDDVQGRNVEYVLKDAFIEKACEWIKSHGGFTLGFDGATVRDFLNFINK